MNNEANNSAYIRTDLATETLLPSEEASISGIKFTERVHGNVRVAELVIESDKTAEIIGKPVGRYLTVSFGKLWLTSDEEAEQVSKTIAAELKYLAYRAVPDLKSVMVVGLGNQYITADSIGPLTVKDIIITRHIKEHDEELFNKMGYLDISSVTPGVVGQTGIETLELIRGAVANVNPSIVVVIDALASRSIDRLAATVQLTDSGISPGSGIGNKRRAINKASLGVPVIAIGVPTVVDSSTLVYDALERAGITDLSAELIKVLENGKSFFVSLKECDIAVLELSRAISRAVNEAFHG
jgi:spore protease